MGGEIAAWVKKHGSAVKASAYGSGSGGTSSSSGLYRLDGLRRRLIARRRSTRPNRVHA